MKRLTYNNLIKAMKYLKRVKHYDDKELCERLARHAFETVEHNHFTCSVETQLAKVLTREEYEAQLSEYSFEKAFI